MASFSMKTSFCLFVAVVCLTLDVEAREGKLFFSKFTHYATNKEVGLGPIPSVSPGQGPSPVPAPGPTQAGGRLGDGQFGPGSGMIPQTEESWPTATTTTSEEFDKLMEKFDGEKSDDETDKFEGENYDADTLTESSEEESYEDEEDEKRSNYYDPREEKGNYHYNNKNNGYAYTSRNYKSNNYNDNVRGYGEERQGMSDTRFMENRMHFHDVKGENDQNDPSRYGVGDRGNSFGGEGYEKNESAHKYPNEFDSMEEYYKSMEGPDESLP